MKNQKGFTSLETVLAVILAISLTGGVIYAVMSKSNTEQPTPPGVAKITIDETFTLKLPEGWKKQAAPQDVYETHETYEAGAVHYYADLNGNYFLVHVDAPSRGYASDAVWNLEKDGDGFRVIQQEHMCDQGPGCSAGNNKFELAMPTGQEMHNGHTYFFMSGNVSREDNVDTGVFKDILASFKVK